MRAVLCTRLGGPEALGVVERECPDPGAGEVKVALQAWGLNFVDVLMVAGGYQHKPELPFVPGLEGAGTVVATGYGVAGIVPGDRVMTRHRPGAFAEEVVVPACDAARIPATLAFSEAACFRSAFSTAYHGLVQGARLVVGETVLVHGAGGGMGLAAVQVARKLGAQVVATAGSEEKRKAARALGAALALDPADGFRDAVREHCGGVDVVFDPVGSPLLEESLRCLNWGARLVVVGFAGGRPATLATNRLLIKGASVTGIRAGEFSRRNPDIAAQNLATLLDWAASGDVRCHISHRFALEQVADAMRVIVDRRAIGRVVMERTKG